ncbi:hypothetical protein ACNOYE_05490 [Nannocystaceae bacterium ST9]
MILLALSGRVTGEEWAQMFSDIDDVLAAGRPFAVVCDATQIKLPDVPELRRCAEFMRLRRVRLEPLQLGIACVTRSAMIRGALKGVARMSSCAVPVMALDCPREALAWAGARIEGKRARDTRLGSSATRMP